MEVDTSPVARSRPGNPAATDPDAQGANAGAAIFPAAAPLPQTPAMPAASTAAMASSGVEVTPEQMCLPAPAPLPSDSDGEDEPAMDTEPAIPVDVVHRARAGVLVWGKQKGYPWWPAILTYDPKSGAFVRRSSSHKQAGCDRITHLHLQFFGRQVTRAWVHIKGVELWLGADGGVQDFLGRDKKMHKRLQLQFDLAYDQAMSSVVMKASERLFEWASTFQKVTTKSTLLNPPQAMAADSDSDGEQEDSKPTKYRDPNRPKKSITSFFAFSGAVRARVKEELGEGTSGAVAAKRIGELWSQLSPEEKAPYDEIAAKDKLRYQQEMANYTPAPRPGGKDPNRPKKPLTAYFRFMKEFRERNKSAGFSSNALLAVECGKQWALLGDAEKEPYYTAAQADQKLHRVAMAAYLQKHPEARKVKKKAKSKSGKGKEQAPAARGAPASTDTMDVDAVAPAEEPVVLPERPTAPSPPQEAYEIFALEHRCAVEEGDIDAASMELATRWTALSLIQRRPYEKKASASREQHKRETKAYQTALLEYERLEALQAAQAARAAQKKRKAEDDAAGPDKPTKKARGVCGAASRNDRICSICEDPGDLICCEGECRASFHPFCIGLGVIPSGSFTCDACTTGNRVCFACDQPGKNLIRCQQGSCGKSFHPSCAKHLPKAVMDKGAAGDKPRFICPLHACANCDVGQTSRSKMVRCVRCPVAYHEHCIPAGCELKERYRIVCPRHNPPSERKKNSNCCHLCGSGGELICCDGCPGAYHMDCVEKCKGFKSVADDVPWHCPECIAGTRPLVHDVVWGKVGAHRWWPCRIITPEECPPIISRRAHAAGDFPVHFFGSHDYFWMNHSVTVAWIKGDEKGRFAQGSKKPAFTLALKEAMEAFGVRSAERTAVLDNLREHVMEKPATFQKIRNNIYTIARPPRSDAPECDCPADYPCGDNCINKMMYIECGRRCLAGKACQNRRFQQRKYPKLVPFKTVSRGWGLKLGEDISEGDFVIEYVGEILDDAECRRRLKEQDKAGIESFYILSLDSGLHIDALKKANDARFINHSCDPNCITQKWKVLGETRVGLFARQDLKAGTELTFDYQLDSLGNVKKVCNCGASTCSGFIGMKPKPKETDVSKLSNQGGKKRVKRKFKRKPVTVRKLSLSSVAEATGTDAGAGVAAH